MTFGDSLLETKTLILLAICLLHAPGSAMAPDGQDPPTDLKIELRRSPGRRGGAQAGRGLPLGMGRWREGPPLRLIGLRS